MTDTAPAQSQTRLDELGPNAGLVEEMYRLYRDNPQAVSAGWREFFADYVPRGGTATPPAASAPATAPAPAPTEQPAPAAPAAPAPTKPAPASGNGRAPVVLEGESPQPLRGAAARVVDNMEASLDVPTATSVRTVPAKLLEVNSQI